MPTEQEYLGNNRSVEASVDDNRATPFNAMESRIERQTAMIQDLVERCRISFDYLLGSNPTPTNEPTEKRLEPAGHINKIFFLLDDADAALSNLHDELNRFNDFT